MKLSALFTITLAAIAAIQPTFAANLRSKETNHTNHTNSGGEAADDSFSDPDQALAAEDGSLLTLCFINLLG